jgi:hypothetical protein
MQENTENVTHKDAMTAGMFQKRCLLYHEFLLNTEDFKA